MPVTSDHAEREPQADSVTPVAWVYWWPNAAPEISIERLSVSGREARLAQGVIEVPLYPQSAIDALRWERDVARRYCDKAQDRFIELARGIDELRAKLSTAEQSSAAIRAAAVEECATRGVELILEDLCDRRGISQAWDEIDGDIQAEISLTLGDKIRALAAAPAGYQCVKVEPTDEMVASVKNIVSSYAARKIWEQMLKAERGE